MHLYKKEAVDFQRLPVFTGICGKGLRIVENLWINVENTYGVSFSGGRAVSEPEEASDASSGFSGSC